MGKSAYLIIEVEVIDFEGMKPYLEKAGEIIASYGGEIIVNNSNIIGLEGDAPNGKVVIIQFNDMETAQACYNSAEYQAILSYRLKSANNRDYLVEALI